MQQAIEQDTTTQIVNTSRLYKLAVLAIVVVPFAATIYAIWTLWNRYVTPLDIGLMIGFYMLTGMGITIGYHRLLTHRGRCC
jgi:stearoyl-CoA desaturase (delta-9 desaturase)